MKPTPPLLRERSSFGSPKPAGAVCGSGPASPRLVTNGMGTRLQETSDGLETYLPCCASQACIASITTRTEEMSQSSPAQPTPARGTSRMRTFLLELPPEQQQTAWRLSLSGRLSDCRDAAHDS
jgi:hypothetical protein